jgi:hypothetical protein
MHSIRASPAGCRVFHSLGSLGGIHTAVRQHTLLSNPAYDSCSILMKFNN